MSNISPEQRGMMPIIAEAQEFSNNARSVMGSAVAAEDQAIDSILAGMLNPNGGNMLLVGPPGGGKSLLSRMAIGLFQYPEGGNLALIPSSSDLQPTAITGGKVSSEKTVANSQGIIVGRETVSQTIPGLVTPNTYALFADEVNRMNPNAANALLSIMEDRQMTTTEGLIHLSKMMFAIATMNPSEGKEATFRMSSASASRFNTGAFVGLDDLKSSKDQDDILLAVAGRHGLKPSMNTQPLARAESLPVWRNAAYRLQMPRGGEEEARYLNAARLTREIIGDEIGQSPALGRIGEQIMGNARGVSIRDGQPMVTERAIIEGAQLSLAGTIGALSRNGASNITEYNKRLAD